MAENPLTLKLTDLTGEAGYFMGWGRGPDNGDEEWDDRKLRDIKNACESALRMVYFQAQIDPRDEAHGWSFLRPSANVAVLSGAQSAALPDDFGGFESEMAVSLTGGSGAYCPIKLTSEPMIDGRYTAYPTTTGRPQMAAERALKGTTTERSSRSELFVWPQADQNYTLRVSYYILPSYLTTANPYPYGGAAHAETFKAAVRAAAEMMLMGTPGLEMQNYTVRLAASIAYDRRHQPKTLGQNIDNSRNRRNAYPGWWPQAMLGWLGPITYDGVSP